MTAKEKALLEYLKKNHNRILKSYNYRYLEIKKLLNDIDFSQLDLSTINPKELIKILDHKLLNEQLETIRKSFQERLNTHIVSSMQQAWNDAQTANDKLFKDAYPNVDMNKFPELFRRNTAQWTQLENRRLMKGRTLSGRVWKLSHQYKQDIVDTLQIGLSNGDSAVQLAKRLERYTLDANQKLKDITKLTDPEIHKEMIKKINLRSKQGSMGSTFKDAKRLAGNETNISYREAEQDRWKNSFVVLGYEIKLSNAHPKTDICDYLAGLYPLWFKWNGWHPNCLCYQVAVLMSDEDVIENTKRRLRGEKPIRRGVIADVSDGFKEYMSEHFEQMNGWKSKPYFMRDNKVKKIIGNTKTTDRGTQ